MRGVLVLAVTALAVGAAFGAGAPAQRPPNATKLFDARYSIVGQYRFTADSTLKYHGCDVVIQGSGGGDARVEGRDSFYYQRYNTPEGERISARLPNPIGRLLLKRFGSLQSATTCPPPDARTTTQQAKTTGCRILDRRVSIETGTDGGRGRFYPVLNDRTEMSTFFYRSEPCPPTQGPHGIMSGVSSAFPWLGVVDTVNPRLQVTERELLRSRFIRRTWALVIDAPLVATDIRRSRIGTQKTVWRMRVLFCAKNAGGCGNRKP